jgi:hypothetical protein
MTGQARAKTSSSYATCDFLKDIINTELTILCSVCERIATLSNVLLSPTAAKFPIKDNRIFIQKRFIDTKNFRLVSLHKTHQSFVKKHNPLELCTTVVNVAIGKGGN